MRVAHGGCSGDEVEDEVFGDDWVGEGDTVAETEGVDLLQLGGGGCAV